MNPSTLRLQLLATSGLILFLELALIRYIPSQVTNFGYFANFILLATFLGIGVGTMIGPRPYPLHHLFPCFLLLLIVVSTAFTTTVVPGAGGEVRFVNNSIGFVLPDWIVVPMLFLLTAATFATLAKYLGTLLDSDRPLAVYTWDILGSLLGIATFAVLAYLQTPPGVWFGIVTLVYLFIVRQDLGAPMVRWVSVCLLIVTAFGVAAGTGHRWSPYQKVTTLPIESEGGATYQVQVNNISHQEATQDPARLPWFYSFPYTAVRGASFERVLIIGAGAGNDVAVALAHGASRVDAVEIDPVLQEIGRDLHPSHPYADPRVSVTIDDGRAFLRKTDARYDLIIFALPDSLVLAASHGNLRLESYLFTQEAFAAARDHLAPGGIFALYNYYREPWLVEKISGMVSAVFGRPSYTYYHPAILLPGIVLNGDRNLDLDPGVPPSIVAADPPPPATDAWPFLYLRTPSLPALYLGMLLVVLTISAVGIRMVGGRGSLRRIEPTYFLLGAAFLLLETKSIAQFALLFGSTWIVNALVFFGILALVFLAITVVHRFRIASLTPWYGALVVALVLQFALPLSVLLPLPPSARYILGVLLTLSPVFLSNVIFARTFRDSTRNSTNFASNLLGATFGGTLEYLALITGYRALVLVILGLYLLAFALPRLRRSPSAGAHPLPVPAPEP